MSVIVIVSFFNEDGGLVASEVLPEPGEGKEILLDEVGDHVLDTFLNLEELRQWGEEKNFSMSVSKAKLIPPKLERKTVYSTSFFILHEPTGKVFAGSSASNKFSDDVYYVPEGYFSEDKYQGDGEGLVSWCEKSGLSVVFRSEKTQVCWEVSPGGLVNEV